MDVTNKIWANSNIHSFPSIHLSITRPKFRLRKMFCIFVTNIGRGLAVTACAHCQRPVAFFFFDSRFGAFD